jgi:hypothetical protein
VGVPVGRAALVTGATRGIEWGFRVRHPAASRANSAAATRYFRSKRTCSAARATTSASEIPTALTAASLTAASSASPTAGDGVGMTASVLSPVPGRPLGGRGVAPANDFQRGRR